MVIMYLSLFPTLSLTIVCLHIIVKMDSNSTLVSWCGHFSLQSSLNKICRWCFVTKILSYVDICKLADWSTKSGVFETFYLRYLWNLMRHILWIFLWIFFSGPRSNKLHFSSFTSFAYFTCLSLLPFFGKSSAFQSYHCKAELNLCYINQYLIK